MSRKQKKINARQRGLSVLSFAQKDESGRGFIAQSIHSTRDLFKDSPSINPLDISTKSSIPFNKTIEEVYYGVHDGPVLGYGISGLIRKITHKDTGEQFAVKRLNMAVVDSEKARLQLIEEIDIMCQLDHPNIVRLEEIYESNSLIYLVQELCHGGELFDSLDEQKDSKFTEEKTVELLKQILSAVTYLHSQGIVHRDLKLENFLFATKEEDSVLKMIDFGLSKHFKYDDVHNEKVGKFSYPYAAT
jgi:calcium-dependent protein kinase